MTPPNQIHAVDLERQQLIQECHDLITLIAQHRYAVRLLRAARDGLQLYVSYKPSQGQLRQRK